MQQHYDRVLVYNMVTVLLRCIQAWLDWPESHWSPQSSVEMPASTESMQCKAIHRNLLMQINWHSSKLFYWCESSGSGSFIHKFLHKCWFCSCQNRAFDKWLRTSWVLEACQPFSSFPSVVLPPQSLTGKLLPLQSPSSPISCSCEAILLAFGKGRLAGHTFPNAQHFYSWGAPTEWTHHAKPWSSQFWLSDSTTSLQS